MGPGTALRRGDAVGGRNAVTGTLPTIADVVAFKEGALFDHGYYRFVMHPSLRELRDALTAGFSCRHCRFAESREVALHELLLALRRPGRRVRVAAGAGVAPLDASFFAACEAPDFQVVHAGQAPAPEAGDVVLAAWPGPIPTGDATPVFLCDADAAPPVSPRAWFVVQLRAPGGAACGAAVLGNADRVMGRLAEQMRIRGPVLSSRAADVALGRSTTGAETEGADERVCRALCAMEGGAGAFLYASGMSAINAVLDAARRPGRSQVVAVGHLFNDTYQGLLKAPRGPGELPNRFVGVDELDGLDDAVSAQTAVILTETITNPLSDVPDLDLLSAAARRHGALLAVDNTLATPANCRPFQHGADVVIHSTTKFLSGANDHGGGAVLLRDAGAPLFAALADRRRCLRDAMCAQEAAALLEHLSSFPERMARFNRNAVAVAGFLGEHPGIARIFFNGHPGHRSHATARRLLAGAGSVMSFTLANDSEDAMRAFYDSALPGIVKAPSLGSDMTLLCPYTLLTHYGEAEEVLAATGLPRHLLRLAVGCEQDITPVLRAVRGALANVEKVSGG